MNSNTFSAVDELAGRARYAEKMLRSFGLEYEKKHGWYDDDVMSPPYIADQYIYRNKSTDIGLYVDVRYTKGQANLGTLTGGLFKYSNHLHSQQVAKKFGTGIEYSKALEQDKPILFQDAYKQLARTAGRDEEDDLWTQAEKANPSGEALFNAHWDLAIDIIERMLGPIASGAKPWPTDIPDYRQQFLDKMNQK